MNDLKMQLLQEILSHLDKSQGGDLHSLMMEGKGGGGEGMEGSPDSPELPEQAIAEADQSEMQPGKAPGGDPMAMDDPEAGESEMSDQELEEMLRKLGG